nr:unnamed protein product [Digitaria exilis]
MLYHNHQCWTMLPSAVNVGICLQSTLFFQEDQFKSVYLDFYPFYPCQVVSMAPAVEAVKKEGGSFQKEPVIPGCFLRAKAIGLMPMIDQGEADDKIIAVCADDPEYKHYNDIKELPPHRLAEIRRFFEDWICMLPTSSRA